MFVLLIISNFQLPAMGELATLPSHALELEDLGVVSGSYLLGLVSGFCWATGKVCDAAH